MLDQPWQTKSRSPGLAPAKSETSADGQQRESGIVLSGSAQPLLGDGEEHFAIASDARGRIVHLPSS